MKGPRRVLCGDGGVFMVFREVDTAYLEFQPQGPGGFRALLHRAEGYRARAASSDWREGSATRRCRC